MAPLVINDGSIKIYVNDVTLASHFLNQFCSKVKTLGGTVKEHIGLKSQASPTAIRLKLDQTTVQNILPVSQMPGAVSTPSESVKSASTPTAACGPNLSSPDPHRSYVAVTDRPKSVAVIDRPKSASNTVLTKPTSKCSVKTQNRFEILGEADSTDISGSANISAGACSTSGGTSKADISGADKCLKDSESNSEMFKDCVRCAQKMPADYDGLYCIDCEEETDKLMMEDEAQAKRHTG